MMTEAKAYLDYPIRPGLPKLAFRWIAKVDKAGLPYAVNICAFTPDIPFCSDPHDNLNVLCGYLKRIACVQKYIGPDVLASLEKTVQRFLLKQFNNGKLKPLPNYENNRLKFFIDWLNNNKNYTGTRKQQLFQEFRHMMFNNFHLLAKHYRCKSFIKREFYEDYKFPRLINSRSDSFKVVVAPFISAIENQLYKLKYFVKHNTPQEIAMKMMKMNKYDFVLETDYSSFESCFQLKYTRVVEQALFKFMMQNNTTTLTQILRCYFHGEKSRVVQLRGFEFLAYSVDARLSGEMWTSLGNGFSNLMNMIYLTEKHNIKFKGLVEGDDGLFNLSSDSISEQDYTDLGFTIKMKYASRLSECSFCGITFDDVSGQLLAAPEQIARLGWTCHAQYLNCRNKTLLPLLKAKAMSIYATNPCTPILGPLAYKIINSLFDVTPNFKGLYNKWILEMPTNWIFKPIPMSCRMLYTEKFGIDLTQQEICESIINSHSLFEIQLPFVFLSEDNLAHLV